MANITGRLGVLRQQKNFHPAQSGNLQQARRNESFVGVQKSHAGQRVHRSNRRLSQWREIEITL